LGLLATAPVAAPLAKVFKPEPAELLMKEEAEFSTIGSHCKCIGVSHGSPIMVEVQGSNDGEMFYNISDETLCVYNGREWKEFK
jgi:hypothetical protein